MGDPRRFTVFAAFIARHAHSRWRIADVAGGKADLQRQLRHQGFRRVETFDRRTHHRRGGGMQYRRRLFTPPLATGFDLLVALHPDEATDVTIVAATQHGLPFMVVPCCLTPTFPPPRPVRYEAEWLAHLTTLATTQGYRVTRHVLPIRGRNVVLWGQRTQKKG